MTLEEFRLAHSELVEHYQFIESHLERIYSCLSNKPFYDGLIEVERDTIPKLMKRIRAIQKKKGKTILTEDEFGTIERICSRRNFWCHSCYVELSFDYKTGNLKRIVDANSMKKDLAEAKEIRDWLFEKMVPLLQDKR